MRDETQMFSIVCIIKCSMFNMHTSVCDRRIDAHDKGFSNFFEFNIHLYVIWIFFCQKKKCNAWELWNWQSIKFSYLGFFLLHGCVCECALGIVWIIQFTSGFNWMSFDNNIDTTKSEIPWNSVVKIAFNFLQCRIMNWIYFHSFSFKSNRNCEMRSILWMWMWMWMYCRIWCKTIIFL